MANVSFTAAAVKPGANAQTKEVIFGATITQGQVLYLDTATNTYKVAVCTALATAKAEGIALTAGGANQPGVIITGGDMTCDGLTAGKVYVLHTAGLIQDVSSTEPAALDYVTVVGVATSATNLRIPASGPIVSNYVLS